MAEISEFASHFSLMRRGPHHLVSEPFPESYFFSGDPPVVVDATGDQIQIRAPSPASRSQDLKSRSRIHRFCEPRHRSSPSPPPWPPPLLTLPVEEPVANEDSAESMDDGTGNLGSGSRTDTWTFVGDVESSDAFDYDFPPSPFDLADLMENRSQPLTSPHQDPHYLPYPDLLDLDFRQDRLHGDPRHIDTHTVDAPRALIVYDRVSYRRHTGRYVFHIVCALPLGLDPPVYTFQIYSSNIDEWRAIGPFNVGNIKEKTGVSCGTRAYWLLGNRPALVFFDAASGRVGRVIMPLLLRWAFRSHRLYMQPGESGGEQVTVAVSTALFRMVYVYHREDVWWHCDYVEVFDSPQWARTVSRIQSGLFKLHVRSVLG